MSDVVASVDDITELAFESTLGAVAPVIDDLPLDVGILLDGERMPVATSAAHRGVAHRAPDSASVHAPASVSIRHQRSFGRFAVPEH